MPPHPAGQGVAWQPAPALVNPHVPAHLSAPAGDYTDPMRGRTVSGSPNTQQGLPPTISVRAASPSRAEHGDAAVMNILGQAHPQSYPTQPLPIEFGGVPTPRDTHLFLGDAGHATELRQGKGGSLAYDVPSPDDTGMHHAQLLHAPDASRRETLRNFLKLDVNMGFESDGKNESPTSLNPVGWKKRRSASDVGPRTPSMLGPSMDHANLSPMDDVSFFIRSMESRATGKENPHAAMPSVTTAAAQSSIAPAPSPPQDPVVSFAAMNLSVDENPVSPAGFQAPRSSSLQEPSLVRADVPFLSVDVGAAPHAQGTPATTLNPTSLIPGPDAIMPQSLAQPFPASYGPEFDGTTSPCAGPVRQRASGRASRNASPYHTPNRSLTPDSDLSLEDPDRTDAARMNQWRFPLTQHVHSSLHPMDAYTRALDGNLRVPAGARGVRRHLRAAVSEDFHHRRGDPAADWGQSVDLSKLSPLTLSMAQLEQQRGGDVSSGGSDGSWTHMHSHSLSPASVMLAMSPASESQEFDTGGHTMPSSPAMHFSPPHSEASASPHSPGRVGSHSPSVQTAAQTCTPIVTTSAAQAASASRRKADAVFTCPFPDCGSTFTRQYNLRGHMRSHMDQRPFKCEWPGCGRSFARTHDCKRHHNLHLNIKPYTCDSCGKTFARLDALNRHHKSEASTCGAHADVSVMKETIHGE
ncbi:hypothetical protein MSPP1_003051 [Malassezia sp. CBS 17886]|nr:hypothetical protein MSPP1_003051 [Malassezia sp. CBS 17886]